MTRIILLFVAVLALVANQNGKLLQRIRTDYRRNVFALEDDATLDLATWTDELANEIPLAGPLSTDPRGCA